MITQFPEISEDGQSLTATWDSFYVDYQTAGVFPGVPAHVVGQNALGIEDPVEAKTALIDALQRRFDDPADTADVKAIAESWNRDFDATSLPANPGVYAGFGPYNLVDFTEDGTMTFEAREDYTWGPQPHVQTIVYSIIGDPTAAVQAMENEEVDIIQPQATADILTQLEAIADRGVEVIQDDGATYEHVDLAQNNGGPFDPAAYGGDAETALAVRKAFLHALPRQDIVDRLIIPLNPDAVVRNAQVAVPGEPGYDELVANNGSDEYAETDIALAQQILADAGVDTIDADRRSVSLPTATTRGAVAEYELIRESVAQAGFNLIERRPDPDWGARRCPTPRCTTPRCSAGRRRRSPSPTRCRTTSPTGSTTSTATTTRRSTHWLTSSTGRRMRPVRTRSTSRSSSTCSPMRSGCRSSSIPRSPPTTAPTSTA